jgi:preprotein translocase subunit SecE
MNEAVPQEGAGGGADTAKVVAAILLVLAGIVAFYVLSGQAQWMRWLAVVAGIALAVVVFATSATGKGFWQFVLDSRSELRKVVWPTMEETRNTTFAVFGFVVLAGLFFWLLDVFLSWATRMLTGQGG